MLFVIRPRSPNWVPYTRRRPSDQSRRGPASRPCRSPARYVGRLYWREERFFIAQRLADKRGTIGTVRGSRSNRGRGPVFWPWILSEKDNSSRLQSPLRIIPFPPCQPIRRLRNTIRGYVDSLESPQNKPIPGRVDACLGTQSCHRQWRLFPARPMACRESGCNDGTLRGPNHRGSRPLPEKRFRTPFLAPDRKFKMGDDGSGRHFNGLIDEARVSNVVLSPDQLGAHRSLLPEPSTLLLSAIALVCAGFLRRRRR